MSLGRRHAARSKRRSRALLLLLVAAACSLLAAGALQGASSYSRAAARADGMYLSFEPWNGGWNNRRLSLEIAVLLAAKLNRTLVLPPPAPAPLTPDAAGFEHYFNVTVLRRHVNVLTWSEFSSLLPSLPARSEAVGCAQRSAFARAACNAALPARVRGQLVQWDALKSVVSWPVVSTANTTDFKAFAVGRAERLPYLQSLQRHTLLHFPQNLFGLFYQFFYYTTPEARRRYHRVARDALVFVDDIQRMARSAVGRLGGQGSYACLHVRRKDFQTQYSSQWLSPELLGTNVGKQLSSHTYVASDEADPGWWRDLRGALSGTVKRISRLQHIQPALELAGRNASLYAPVVEQLLCAKARVFVGTKYSTFSSYIVRLRGYDAGVSNKQSYFTDTKYAERRPVLPEDAPYSWSGRWRKALWAREYPEAWEGVG